MQVPWFAHTKVWNSKKQMFVERPTGNLCQVGGRTLEVFCNERPADVLHNRLHDLQFAEEYKFIRIGVAASVERELAQKRCFWAHKVESDSLSGMTVSRTVAFVTSDVYKQHFDPPLGEDGCPAELLRFPFLNYRKNGEKGGEGTVLEISELPRGMPYEKCKVWATTQRCLNQVLLKPEDVHRAQQGLDRYSFWASPLTQARP